MSASSDSHWWANVAPVMPFASAMSAVDAVNVSPTRAVPSITGAPMAALFSGRGTVLATASGPKLSMSSPSASRSTVPPEGFA